MPEVDPATGFPKVEMEKKSNMERLNRLDEQKVQSDRLVSDLNTEQGQLILNKIKQQLLNRVNKLIDEDGECKALKRLLIDMGVTISVGDMAVERLMKLVMKQAR